MTIDTDFLEELNHFNLVLKKKVLSQYQGSRESQSLGQGLLFKDFREYVLGDDIRHIDWKAYARTNKYFIREFEEERNLILRVIIDRSKSMDFGTPKKKFEYGAMLGLGLGYLAHKNNEKFEISTFANDLQVFRPQKSRARLVTVLNHLGGLKIDGQSDLRSCLYQYEGLIKSKSLLVIVSDFLFDIKEIRESLHRIKKNDVVIIQILDPSELHLSLYGNMFLKDSESDFSIKTFISSRFRSRYLHELDHHPL